MWKNNHMKEQNISLHDIKNANKITENVVNKTPMFKLQTISNILNKPVYYKDESKQITSSFKGRGVYYCVFNKLKNITKKNIYIVTQSTGNHGIATLFSLLHLMKNSNNKYVKSVIPVIFASKNIQKNKLNKMKYYLNEIRKLVNDFNYGEIKYNYNSYKEALENRIKFVNKHNAIYIEHGFIDIIVGHGTMGLEIYEQLKEKNYTNKSKITFLAACGAGGPIGIGICLKNIFNNCKFVIVQTNDQNALIESLKQNKIVKNKEIIDLPFNFADGIAVDKPEREAFELCKNYADYGITVNHQKCFELSKQVNNDILQSYTYTEAFCGGTSVSVYLALLNLKDEEFIKNSDAIILLGCEGNIDKEIIDFLS